MLHLERLAVHLREAERLTSSSNVSELRIALILLDSAAELQMYRQAQSELGSAQMYTNAVNRIEGQIAQGRVLTESEQESLEDSRSKSVSKTRRKKIDRDFSEKAAYLSERGLFSPAEVRVLNKLHDYRNATYHRDILRPDTVKSAVHIYLWLNCQMMLRFKPMMIELLSPPWPDTLEPFFSGRPDFTMTTGVREVATTILDRSGLLAETAPSSFLSSHALDRIEALVEEIERCAYDINSLSGRQDYDFDIFLFDAQLRASGAPYPSTPEELKKIKTPVTRRTFAEWKLRATELSYESDPIIGFSKFADLEDELERIEDPVEQQAYEIDEEIQRRIDWARGK